MANLFKKVIDRQMWAQVAPTPVIHYGGQLFISDLRSGLERHPFALHVSSATIANRFNIVTKSWQGTAFNPGMGAMAIGATGVYAPSFGLKGTLAAGATTTTVTPGFTIGTAVGLNMLANRGGSGDYGFRIKIVGSAAGSSGKTEERWIVANTAGNMPTMTIDPPLSFTPVSGDAFEILGGRFMMLSSGTAGANSFRSYEVVTNAMAPLGYTGLPAVGTDSAMVCLDERYTPYDMEPGEGQIIGSGTYNSGNLRCLVATAAGASSLTGQATGGDAVVKANEYRNFQIRIVEDTVNTTAVGQRKIIASHTAGASPVYTLGTTWGVQPSANAKFVIENPNLIILRSSASATVYTYNCTDGVINNGTNSIAANTWSTSYFQAAGNASGVGCLLFPSYGIQPDSARNARHSFVHFFRGSGVAVDILDIAGAINGTWENGAVIDGAGTTSLTTGTCGCYSPFGSEGRMAYLNIYANGLVNQIYRYDVQNRVLSPFTTTDWVQAGAAAGGQRMAAYCAVDGTEHYDVILLQSHLSTICQEMVVLC